MVAWLLKCNISMYTSLYFFFMATKVNRSTKSDFLHISKNHNKKNRQPKKKVMYPGRPT